VLPTLLQLEGEIGDALKGRFDRGLSLPALVDCLEKAAYDPRISGVCFEIGPLAVSAPKNLRVLNADASGYA
jgi:hypothetical protein